MITKRDYCPAAPGVSGITRDSAVRGPAGAGRCGRAPGTRGGRWARRRSSIGTRWSPSPKCGPWRWPGSARGPAPWCGTSARARAREPGDVARSGGRVVGGTAPEALDGLPDPDAVFVGGGGLAVVSAVAARRPARIVVALAAVQRAGQAAELLGEAGYQVGGTLLQASRLAPLPGGAHRLAAANPVFLLWAQPI